MPVFVIVLLALLYIVGFVLKSGYMQLRGESRFASVAAGLFWPVLSVIDWTVSLAIIGFIMLATGDTWGNVKDVANTDW